MAKLREQRAGRAIPNRECKSPECSNTFHPRNRSVEYWCGKCHRDHQAVVLGMDMCANPACGKLFDKRFAFEKYCEAKCRREMEHVRLLPGMRCAWCGELFSPLKISSKFVADAMPAGHE
ncbi:hypothetical protein GA830_14005 [Mesorhizobium sp. NBSH29]|nr:hypothetical protein GA830_14005 [Mesorhizobium sp. NBSH29]